MYGLAVTGAGLVTYVDAAFGVRSGMAPVEVVVDAVAGLPRGKALTDRVLGDVNGDGQVTIDDALLVMTYSSEGSVVLPPNGDISLGDVNGDGQVNMADAQLLTTYVANPADPWLPAGIGQAVASNWVNGAIRRLNSFTTYSWSQRSNRDISWSPDGQHIAFRAAGRGLSYYKNGIYVMDSDGSNPRRLTPDGGRSPSWSPDGRHIAFTFWRDHNWEIYVMGSDGSNPRRLTDLPAESPTWSPDGRHIAFSSDRDGDYEIYVMDSDGTNPRNLTNDSAWDFSPSWSPDGRHIAFVRGGEIYVMDSDGSNPRRLTTDGGRSPSWSPDGRHIAFESNRDHNYESRGEIYVIGSDGSNPRRLTYNSTWDISPSWSPDGRHIAFMSNLGVGGSDGIGGVYVMELREAGRGGPLLDDADSPAMAIPLVVGAFIEGELSAGDSDYFRVTVTSPGTLMARTTGSTDTSIEDSSGNVLNENDGGGGRNFRVSAAVEPGTYYIRVRGAIGPYTLIVHFDDAGSPETAIPVAVGESIKGELSAGDNDYFRVTVTSKGLLTARTTGSTDTYGFIEDSSGDILNRNDDGGEGSNFHVSAIVGPGTYYIRVRSNSDGVGASPDTGPYTLTLMIMRLLTDHPASSPSWSPDGRHIAFVSNRDGDDEIYVMGSDGTNPRRLTMDGGKDPSWSPDGRHIAFWSERDDIVDVYVMDSDGTNPRLLTNHPALEVSPSWSPDGRHIAFVSNRDRNREIYVMDSDGTNPRNLTNNSASDWSPTWSPDGRHIAFVSSRDGDGGEIYVMGSDGTNPRRLTMDGGRDPSWSPDGQHIAFSDGGEIYVMDSDGSNPRRLTMAYGRDPSWSPDGRHIALVSRRAGNDDIYVMEFIEEGSGGTPFDDGDSPTTATPPLDDDDSPATAIPLAVGASIEGELSAGDSDYFRVTVASPGTLMASTTGSTDTYGSIEDSSGNVLHENDDGGEGRNFRVSAVVEPGTYYIRVRGFDPSSTGDYTLTLQMEEDSAGSGETPLDDDDSPATAIPLAVGASIEGELSAGDSDYFRVTVASPGTLMASTTGSTDTYGSIEDSSGNVLHENDDGGEGRNFRVSAVVEPGTYYIRVRGFDPSSTGDYTLTLQMEEGSDDSGGDGVVGAMRRLTNSWDYSPTWSPDGRHIAFVSSRDDNFDIYVMESDGSNQRRLTNHSGPDDSPTWSPDGRYIAFRSRRDGNSGIYVMESDGTNLRQLTNSWGSSPSWSPDGRHIAFESSRDDNFDIYVMESDGSNQRRLTNHSGFDLSPTWSPDGRHIAFESRRDDGSGDIYVMGSDGTNQRNLTNDPAEDGGPTWSPDGRHIAFASLRDGNRDIYVMELDGTNLRRLTNDPADDLSPTWSPDGRHIAFASGSGGIFVVELRQEGGGETPLDDGDSPATGIPLAVGESIEIERELPAGGAWYFEVTVTSAGRLIASTIGSTDTYGFIEDSSGNVLHENDDGGEGRNFRVSAVVEPGTYYIRVRGFDDSSTGAFTLTIQLEAE